MGLCAAGVPHKAGGGQAAMDYLAGNKIERDRFGLKADEA